MKKGLLVGLTLASASAIGAYLTVRRNLPAAAGVAGGAALGLGSFFLLERFVRGLGPGEVRPRTKAALALAGIAAGAMALALLPGSVLWVLAGFSCYVGGLVTCAVVEAFHA